MGPTPNTSWDIKVQTHFFNCQLSIRLLTNARVRAIIHSSLGRFSSQGGPMKKLFVCVLVCVSLFAMVSISPAAEDGLDEVNAARAVRGLPPFQRDEGLSQAAAG